MPPARSRKSNSVAIAQTADCASAVGSRGPISSTALTGNPVARSDAKSSAGHVVEECRKRGWLLVAPRAGLFGAPPVEEVIAALAARYPIDPKRVFLVGHSMGAGQAAELVQRSPGQYRGLGLLGGAARVRDAKAFADLPLFLGVGTKDQLALTGMRSLNKSLTAAGAKRLTYREYPEAEHLVVVREALPDAFAQWDALLAK